MRLREAAGVCMLASVVMVATIPLTPAAAHACSYPDTQVYAHAMPADGATDVPTNAQVLVNYYIEAGAGGCWGASCSEEVLLDVRLTRDDGTEVPSTTETHIAEGDLVDWLRIVPDVPFEPNTRYRIWTRFEAAPGCSYMCVRDERVATSTFETGTRRDTTAPTFAGLSAIGEMPASGASSSECGYFSAIWYSLYWADAVDEGSVAYRVEGEGTGSRGVLVLPGQENTLSGSVPCSGWVKVPVGLARGRGPFHVVAIDLAGNEDDNDVTMGVEGACFPAPDPEQDAGPTSSTDGGTPPDGDGGPTHLDDGAVRGADAPGEPRGRLGGGGCACTVHAASSAPNHPLAWLALSLLGALPRPARWTRSTSTASR